MREIATVFQKGLSVGLRKSITIGANTEYLAQCYNMVVEKEGLLPREDVISPISTALEYPFPILYIGASNILYFTKDTVYTVDGNWDPLYIYSVKYDELVDWGGKPHIADFQEYIVWTTPVGTWKFQEGRAVRLQEWGGETCCNYRQQLLLGEASLPLGPERDIGGTINGASVKIPTEGTVAWGIIGDTEFRYQLGQENGWMTLPFLGKVLALIPMGERVYAYHQNGIYRLTPVQEPTPTFGALEFGNIGPLNRDCVAGDDNAHVLLGADRRLYLILPEKALSDQGRLPINLDYKEFMMTLENPIVTFDALRRHWWIGDTKRCFIYNGVGLSEASFTPTSLGNLNGQLLGCGAAHGSDEAIVTTGASSFNLRDIKTLMAVETDVWAETAYGQALWRNDFSKPLKATQVKKLDPRGFFFPVVAGVEFSVRVQTGDFRTTQLSKLIMRYKVTDRTSVRGITNIGAPQEGV